jgi:hypothetical protein
MEDEDITAEEMFNNRLVVELPLPLFAHAELYAYRKWKEWATNIDFPCSHLGVRREA